MANIHQSLLEAKKCDDLVYFVEDDYLHKKDSLKEMIFTYDRIASQILGMGDVLTLIEDIEKKTDKEKSLKLSKKIKKGKGFNLDDFKDQIKQMSSMGGISNIIDKLPGTNKLPGNITSQINDSEFIRLVAVSYTHLTLPTNREV